LFSKNDFDFRVIRAATKTQYIVYLKADKTVRLGPNWGQTKGDC